MWEFETLIAHPHGEMQKAYRVSILNSDERAGLATDLGVATVELRATAMNMDEIP